MYDYFNFTTLLCGLVSLIMGAVVGDSEALAFSIGIFFGLIFCNIGRVAFRKEANNEP